MPDLSELGPQRWEELLTAHYLRSDGPSGASPIRSIDATSEELARAAGEANLSPSEAVASFLRAFRPSYDAPEVLRGFRRPPASGAVPGFFRYLVLSAHVPAVAVENAASKDFRVNLGKVLGWPGPLDNVSALPGLWEELHRWCEARRAEGKPFRRLVLPDPGSWTHIGYSVRLAFPSWRDRERLARRAAEVGSARLAAPRSAIALLKHEIDFGGYSPAMRDAFDDFRSRFQRGERLLSSHRFWRLLNEVTGSPVATAAQGLTAQPVLRLIADLDGADGELEFIPTGVQDDEGASARYAGPAGLVLPQVARVAGEAGSACREISQAATAGLLLFVERDWGSWHFQPLTSVRGQAIALARSDVVGRLAHVRAKWTPAGGDWSLSSRLPPGLVEEAVSAVLRARPAPADDELATVALVGAVRTGLALLGRPTTLPWVRASSSAVMRLEPAAGARGHLRVEERPGNRPFDTGLWALAADGTVGGSWRLLVREADGDEGGEAEVLLRLDEAAVEHVDLANPDRSPENLEWEPDMLAAAGGAAVIRPLPAEAGWRGDERLVDLLEAVYAGGRSGWAEADLVPLIRRILPEADPQAAFDVLHLLQSCGWLEPRLLVQWKGRRWFLRPPRVLVVCGGDGPYALLDGATPLAVRERFRAALAHGSTDVVERAPCGGWGIPILVGRTDAPSEVASALGVELSEASAVRAEAAPLCWPQETRSLTNRERASAWCWSSGAFRARAPAGPGGVRLERHVRLRGDDRDVYSVSASDGSLSVFASRSAAVVEAHRLAGRALFEFEGARLVRTARDGHIPSAAARHLRLVHLTNPGFVRDGSGPPRLAYPADRVSAQLVRRWFGPAIGVAAAHKAGPAWVATLARHRSPRDGIAWIGGPRDRRLGHVGRG